VALGAILVLLGLVTCARVWLHAGGLLWVFGWPGIAFVAVGVAHILNVRSVFGKRADGTIGKFHMTALLPFLAFTWATWHLVRATTREPMIHSLTPELWLGRRLLATELPVDVDHVVDLTAEFREAVRARSYTSLPILDGGIPDQHELRSALDAVPRCGTTFVHCAQGHGRTALFAACFLIDREGVDADTAIARVLAARPRARMRASQRSFVTEFAAQRRADPLKRSSGS
jgi:protein-tyrosine phosphatase